MIHAHTLLVSSSSQEHLICPTQNISSYLPAIPGCLLNWRDFKSMSMSVSCLLNWYQFENLTFKVNVLSLTRFWLHLKSLTLPVKHLDDQFHFFSFSFHAPKVPNPDQLRVERFVDKVGLLRLYSDPSWGELWRLVNQSSGRVETKEVTRTRFCPLSTF